MRILQLSDPHLVAADAALVRERPALALLERALLEGQRERPDLLLISGDLCQDESWGGYVRLGRLLDRHVNVPVGLLPGNHDHPLLLKAVLGRRFCTAPAELIVQGTRLVLLNSHRSGCSAGWLGPHQLQWLQQRLADPMRRDLPLVVALHHPPVAIGHPVMDTMNLSDHHQLAAILQPHAALRAVVFGHIHQHWHGTWPQRPDVPLLGCPSTLRSFQCVQPCPLGRAEDPGGRLLEIHNDGSLSHQVLRWSPC